MQPVRYMVANGFTEFRPNSNYHDVSPFSAMDGTVLNSNDEFPESEDIFLEFSNASGKKKKGKAKRSSRKSARLDRREERRSKRDERRTKREERKDRKLAIKEQDSLTQKKVAESVGQTSPEEALLMQQLASGDQNQLKTADASQGQGMSKGMKIGLIVGGVVVLGVVSILVIRKMRKK